MDIMDEIEQERKLASVSKVLHVLELQIVAAHNRTVEAGENEEAWFFNVELLLALVKHYVSLLK